VVFRLKKKKKYQSTIRPPMVWYNCNWRHLPFLYFCFIIIIFVSLAHYSNCTHYEIEMITTNKKVVIPIYKNKKNTQHFLTVILLYPHKCLFRGWMNQISNLICIIITVSLKQLFFSYLFKRLIKQNKQTRLHLAPLSCTFWCVCD